MKTKIIIALSFSAAAFAICIASLRPAGGLIEGVSAAEPAPKATPVVKRTSGKQQAADFTKLVFLDDWDGTPLTLSDAEWKAKLTKMQYYILRQAGTENAYSGALNENKKKGTYYCAACGLALFRSTAKFDSQTGWPSFWESISRKNVGEETDRSLPEETRTEVHCNRCHGHLGHVFDDGPQPTGLRYCINSAALVFRPDAK